MCSTWSIILQQRNLRLGSWWLVGFQGQSCIDPATGALDSQLAWHDFFLSHGRYQVPASKGHLSLKSCRSVRQKNVNPGSNEEFLAFSSYLLSEIFPLEVQGSIIALQTNQRLLLKSTKLRGRKQSFILIQPFSNFEVLVSFLLYEIKKVNTVKSKVLSITKTLFLDRQVPFQ